MALNIGMITVDSTDPRALAQWWQQALGGDFAHEPDDDFVILKTEHGTLAFQKVEDPTPGKNRLHLDLEAGAGERQAEVDRLVGLGASVSARHDEGEGFGWVTLADPQGNLFDIAGASADGS
jgi:hypothetical protein